MSSEESLSTRLRPGVTTKMGKSKASTNLQDDLMRLIDPDIAESDLASILVNMKQDLYFFENSVDPDQLAAEQAN